MESLMNAISKLLRGMALFALLIGIALLPALASAGTSGPQSEFATVNGVKLHYLREGTGPAVILLHGYAETSHMWLPLIPELAKTHTVIAPDLRGAGESGKPEAG